MKTSHQHLLIYTLIALITHQPALEAASSNLPTGGTFVAGKGNISASGNVLTINQNSLKGIIDWSTFSIGSGSIVNFKNGAGATLNKVTGATSTTILGQLLATGNIYLLNPEGILISKGATIHTGGDFLATTLSIPNASFLSNSPLSFLGSSQSTVVNLGTLTSDGGNIYLIGRSVSNNGSIASPNGTTGLAAGSEVLIADTSNNQKVSVQAPGGDVTNSGFLSAAQVELKSNGGNIYALAGNNGGQIQATGTATQNGHVWLVASNGTTNVSGSILATNADGTGGDIETSGSHVITNAATIKTGKNGNWLLDPDDLTIDTTLAGTIETSLNGGTNVTEQTSASGTGGSGDITVASSIAWTGAADLTLSAYRGIGFNPGVVISNTGSGNLTLRADNASTGVGTVNFANAGQIDWSNSTGNVALLYNPSSYTSPTDYSSNVLTNGSWAAPADGSVSSQFTAYMLVNTPTDLENISTNLAGTYGLGQNIDLSSIPNWTPLAPNDPYFTGILDGMGHTISNLTINTSSPSAVLGLFAEVNGAVRNLNMTGVSIAASGNNEDSGAVAGIMGGTISNVVVAGIIHTSEEPNEVGGLVGEDDGLIQNSHSSATIDASLDIVGGFIGGLIGYSEGLVVRNSYATGSVSAPSSNGSIGGLAGGSEAPITNSWATGNVTGGASANVGGLVGSAYYGLITGSYATGAVTGGVSSYVGGLIGTNEYAVTDSWATGVVSGEAGSQIGGLIGSNSAAVTDSWASGAVSGGGDRVGGLVGYNYPASPITNSYATGSVTSSADGAYIGGLVGVGGGVSGSYANGAVSSTGGSDKIGGLVGGASGDGVSNSYATGAITSTIGSFAGGLVGEQEASIANSYATGNLSGPAYMMGGLVGYGGGVGTISNSYATGNVSMNSGSGHIGGLVAENYTPISNSYATGNVSVTGSAYANPGGLVGDNYAAITNSHATGAVSYNTTNSNSFGLGGLVGVNNSGGTITNSYATGNVTAVSAPTDGAIGGLVGYNSEAITGSYSTGAVSDIGATSYSDLGGLVGASTTGGTISNSYATGSVTGSQSHDDIGGLVGVASDAISGSYATGSVTATGSAADNLGGLVGQTHAGGTITNSYATGSVTASPTSSGPTAGGLVGIAQDTITQSWAGGAVTGNDGDSYLGGLVGLTFSNISTSYAMGSVSGLGQYSSVGGLAGDVSNSPTITDTYARGNVTGGPSACVGGLVGCGGGTIATSYSSGLVTGGAGATVGGLFAGSFTATSSYFDNTVNPSVYGNGVGSQSGVTGESTAMLQSGNMPTGFNALNQVWTAPANVYPYFGYQGSLVTINGTAYNGSTVIASASIGALSGGATLGSATTNSNGFYTFYEPQNMVNSAGVLTYLQSIGTANTFSDGTNGYTGMNLYTGTVNLISSASNLSAVSAAVAAALGGNSGSNFLASVPSGQLNLNSGANLTLNSSAANFTIDQPLSGPGNILITTPGNLTVAASSPITAASGYNITLVDGGTLTNNAGSSALNVSGGGQWLVYSQNPANDTTGSLPPSFIQYNATYGVTTPAQSGNGLLYALAPVITASLTGSATKTYDGTSTAVLSASNFSTSGAVNGDNVTLSPATGTYATPNVGNNIAVTATGISIASATNGSLPVYGYQVSNTAAGNIGFIDPATLTYVATAANQSFGSANTSFSGTVTGFVNGETLSSATSGTATFNSSTTATSPVGTYAINGSGLTANHGNYIFTQAPGNASALTIAAAAPAPTPTPTPVPIPVPGSTTIDISINNATAVVGQAPSFTATYSGSPINGINISSLLAGLTYQITPALNGPGTYKVTATGTAPAGYTFSIAPATFTVVDNSPTTLPSVARLFAPETPTLVAQPEESSPTDNLLQPFNSFGLFQIDITSNTGATFGSSFSGFGSQTAPLSQSSFFSGSQKPEKFVAGAKP